MNDIIGSFIFRIEDGNLVGQYTNLTMNQSLGENAIRTRGNANVFTGEFNSTWEEIAGGADTAVLSIGRLPGSIDKFTLIWHQNRRIYFRG